jgi:predicted ABC-type ATPase
LIAGCNGAGKTTFAKEFLPREVKCLRFLNADEIARGLSPLQPTAGAAKAARLLLREIHDAIHSRQTFGLETTLVGLTYVRTFVNARERGYAIKVFYLWLPSATVAIRRVRERVRKGGHSVPAADIRRRYTRSLRNLVRHYLPLADEWTLFDNSGRQPRLVADGIGTQARVMDETLYRQILSTSSPDMKPTSTKKNGKGAPGTKAALRALRRAAHKVHAENRKLGLPLILWKNGKVVEKPA